MANVGVTFDFAAESAKLRGEIDKVRKELKSINATADGIKAGFKALGGVIAGAFSVGAITSFLRSVNQAADQLNDLSGRLGASASNLQVLQVAAQQAGGSADSMNAALAKMSATLGDALAGQKQAVQGFERLGLSAQELATLKTDEAFTRIAAALGSVGNVYERASIAQDIFGKGAKDLAGLFADAPLTIAAFNAKLGEFGAASAAAGRAAGEFGAQVGQVDVGRMTTAIAQAAAGTGPAAGAFQRLGLSVESLASLAPDEQFRKIAEALLTIPDAANRAAVAEQVFGDNAAQIITVLEQGTGVINDTNRALAEQGALLQDLDVAKIGVMNDELALQGVIVQNLGVKFLANLSPAVGVATEAFAGLIQNMGGATHAGKTFGTIVVAAVKMIEAGVYSLAAVFEALRGVVATVLAAITNAVGNLVGGLARLGELAGLDIGTRLRGWSDAALRLGESLATVGGSAFANARAAGAAAIQAGAEVFNAATIFDEAAARLEARAASIAASAGAAAGTATAGAAAPGAAAAGVDPTKARGQFGLSRETERDTDRAIAAFDPLSDPRVLQEMQINSALQVLQDQHAATMLGKMEAFENTTLGMVLASASLQEQIQASKNVTIGSMMSDLASMAIQQGGKLGKAGKALAIAQTIWSTGQAIMTAMAQVPWPANIAAAALAAAMGVAQLANIKKTNVGSSGSISGTRGASVSAAVPSVSGSMPDNVAGAQKAEDRAVTQVVIQGNVFSSQETAEWIIGQIRDAVNTRDTVFINANSRQAMELMPA